LPPRNPIKGSDAKYANERKNPRIIKLRGALAFLSICPFFNNNDCKRSETDRIARQPVIIQGKKDGWVVFWIFLVSRLAVKYA
jgi:hypothetical protein